MFLFLVEKGALSVLYKDIYFKGCWHEVRSSLKCTPTPPPKKLRTGLRLPQSWKPVNIVPIPKQQPSKMLANFFALFI